MTTTHRIPTKRRNMCLLKTATGGGCGRDAPHFLVGLPRRFGVGGFSGGVRGMMREQDVSRQISKIQSAATLAELDAFEVAAKSRGILPEELVAISARRKELTPKKRRKR